MTPDCPNTSAPADKSASPRSAPAESPVPGLPRGIIGVVHLPPLPGDPRCPAGTRAEAVLDFALRDADALAAGGVDGIVVENFGSTPFFKGTAAQPAPPHQVAFLAVASQAVRARFDGPLGVNCLRNDACASLGVALATAADFIRVNVHVGAYVTDQGLIEGEAARTLAYRRRLGAEHVAIYADVLVKHAAPLAPLPPPQAAHDCVDRGLADALLVTGDATGAPVSVDLLREVRQAAHPAPVLIGSGLTPESAPLLAPEAHGAVVGTWLKRDGDVRAPVDPDRVQRLCCAVRPHLRPLPDA
jgi:hypothetical protein